MQYLLNAGTQRQGTAAYKALCDESASAVGIVLEWLMFAFENTLLEEIGLAFQQGHGGFMMLYILLLLRTQAGSW
jgi:hypothetical protein